MFYLFNDFLKIFFKFHFTFMGPEERGKLTQKKEIISEFYLRVLKVILYSVIPVENELLRAGTDAFHVTSGRICANSSVTTYDMA